MEIQQALKRVSTVYNKLNGTYTLKVPDHLFPRYTPLLPHLFANQQ